MWCGDFNYMSINNGVNYSYVCIYFDKSILIMIKLYFTNDEMRDFLIKEGFQTKKIKTWSSYNTYHNQVEDNYQEIEVAFESDVDKFNNSEDIFKKDTVDKFELSQVFSNVIKYKLLSL